MLQWGRGFSAAESGQSAKASPYTVQLQWGRGFSAAESKLGRLSGDRVGRFNGAAASQPRSLHFCQGLPGTFSLASMGPRLLSRGVEGGEIVIPRWLAELQWGRGFSAAESREFLPSVSPRRVASMGPRLLSRGVPESLASQQHYMSASMGPRLLSRGVGSVTHIGDWIRSASMGPRLLSRGVRSRWVRRSRRAHRFNGAAASQPRSHFDRARHVVDVRVASMGPRLLSRGVAATAWAAIRAAGSFNGAAASQPRSPNGLGPGRARQQGFNGAAASQPRSPARTAR